MPGSRSGPEYKIKSTATVPAHVMHLWETKQADTVTKSLDQGTVASEMYLVRKCIAKQTYPKVTPQQ